MTEAHKYGIKLAAADHGIEMTDEQAEDFLKLARPVERFNQFMQTGNRVAKNWKGRRDAVKKRLEQLDEDKLTREFGGRRETVPRRDRENPFDYLVPDHRAPGPVLESRPNAGEGISKLRQLLQAVDNKMTRTDAAALGVLGGGGVMTAGSLYDKKKHNEKAHTPAGLVKSVVERAQTGAGRVQDKVGL